MNYAILIYESDQRLHLRDDPETRPAYSAAYQAYTTALREAGVLRGGEGLMPPRDATTVRLREGKRQVQDGPFADTKERLAGFYLIEVPDLDKALEWAARCPSVEQGSVEIRPLLPRHQG